MNTWVCIGSGPSLTERDIDFCRQQGWKLAGCNMAYKIAPDLDLFHAMDSQWWEVCGDDLMATLKPTCEHWSGSIDHATKYKANYLTWDGEQGWSDQYGHCHGGKLSGLQLINIVGWKKPDLIILLGYDNQHSKGQAHWHHDYPQGMVNGGIVDQQAGDYAKLWRECPISVINCSRQTSINDVPRETLETVSEWLKSGDLPNIPHLNKCRQMLTPTLPPAQTIILH